MGQVTSILVGLTIPFAVVAIGLGTIAFFRAVMLMKHPVPLRRSPAAERFAMFLCGFCVTAGIAMAADAVRGANYPALSLAALQIVFAAAGLALYFTRRRPLSEALAAMAIGVFTILTGFSLGAYVAPFTVAMGVLANHHLRLERRTTQRHHDRS